MKKEKKIRFRNPYLKKEVNVNFVEILENKTLQVRKRGRKLNFICGRGVTASVIAAYETNKISSIDIEKILVHTIGGKLWVSL